MGFLLYETSMSPYVWKMISGYSAAPPCFIYNGMSGHIIPTSNNFSSCNLNAALGHIAILITFG